LPDASARRYWFDAYVRTYLERDLQALASITALPGFRRVMRAAALRLGQVLNQSDLARDVAVAQPTVCRWLNLLAVGARHCVPVNSLHRAPAGR